MNSFNQIYVLDLHGNSKKKEKCPDGSKDENVFDIQQGVAIILAVKKKSLRRKVMHRDDWGLRQDKYEWLKNNHVKSTRWVKLSPKSEFYFFVPRDERLFPTYQKYAKITEIFPVNDSGVVTSRDSFVISADKAELENRVRMFRNEDIPDSAIKQAFDLRENKRWKLKTARKKIQEDNACQAQIKPILYRPFDQRWIFYNDAVVERCRREKMRHLMQENLGLVGMRQYAYDVPSYNYTFVTNQITESRIFISNRGIANVFPLYLYPEADLYNGSEKYERQVNIEPKVLEALDAAYGKKFEPEDVFCYIYAVLYSSVYRLKYAEFLKSDFPRIPFCEDYKVFRRLAVLGKKLVELHLMKSDRLNRPVARFEGKGDNLVEKVSYDMQKSLVYINPRQSFGSVTKQIWEYQIGGYQVMEKWLGYRKKRRLTLDEIKHYCQIATAIKETIAVQTAIDRIYPQIENNVLEIGLSGKCVS
jgi:predicted helicase